MLHLVGAIEPPLHAAWSFVPNPPSDTSPDLRITVLDLLGFDEQMV